MKINLYDENLNRVAIIDERFVSCFWSEGYNTTENFTLELQETEEYKKKVREDCYVGRSDRKTLMVIKTVEIANNKIIASGKQATQVLDDVAFIGTINVGSEIDSSLETAYNNSNKFKNVEIVSSGLSQTYKHQISNKHFLELCETMCQSEDIGFRSVKNNRTINIEFYKPNKKSNLVFSQKFGNLSVDRAIFSSSTFKNYAIVLGEGEGENRVRVDVDQTNGNERRELIVDARNIQKKENETNESYNARLKARGAEKLLERRKVIDFVFSPFAKDFGVKYDLGDILTVLLPEYGMKLQSRVVRFTQIVQNNQTTTTIDVGNLIIKR